VIVASQNNVLRVSDDRLREFVQSALGSAVRRLSRSFYDYHSSFAIEALDAELNDGSELSLIFKDLSPRALLEEARCVRPNEFYRPGREIIVYREILNLAGLGTPNCYGSLMDQEADRYWLLLEKVAANELYTIGDLSIWCHVARWLARMHSQFSESPNIRRSSQALLSYDSHFFNACLKRAESQVERRAAECKINPSRVNNLWTQYRKAVSRICSLPRTLIHGEFYPSNILVSRQDSDYRVCAVDWETAGIGAGLLDLAALVSGKWTEQQRQDLARAYFEELENPQMLNDVERFTGDLLICRLHIAVAWLGWSPDWQPPLAHQHNWLEEALAISQQLQNLDKQT
jgi:Ser/Thr protein kinase RdoA (MazF antagonist)